MKTVILAGGKGTRLGLGDIPKPMAELDGKPVLEHQILLAKRYGLCELILLTGFRSEVIEKYFGDGSRFGVSIRYCREDRPQGTAGAFLTAREEIGDERFLVFYGDLVMDIDVRALLDEDRKSLSLGTLVVHPNDHPHDSDLVECEPDGRITAFHSKPHPEKAFYRNLVNAAVYVLDPGIFRYVRPGEDWGHDVFPRVIAAGGILRAYNTAEYLKDMGTPERFAEITAEWRCGRIAACNRSRPRRAFFLDRDGVINREVGNLRTVDDMELLPGAAEAVAAINKSGYLAIVVTNQPVIAKGWLDETGLARIHAKMESLLGREGAYLNGVYHCPHHPDKGYEGEVAQLKTVCHCRKPAPGMILEAIRHFNVDPARSFLIGDRNVDIEAAASAGIGKAVLIPTNAPGAFLKAVQKLLKEAL